MKVLATVVVLAVSGAVLAAPPPPKADKKTNKELIVGTWEMVKSTNGVPGNGTVYHLEFTKDGKMTMSVVTGGNKRRQYEAKYKVEGDNEDKLPYESVTEGVDKKETLKIKK